jgi:hypothetical protein
VGKKRVRGAEFDLTDWALRWQWGQGRPVFAYEYHPVDLRSVDEIGGWRPLLWECWAQLFEVYQAVRDEYLAEADGWPGIERLFQAWRRGGAHAAEAERNAMAAEHAAEPDPRLQFRYG